MGRKNKTYWGNKNDKRQLEGNVNSFIKYRDQLMELGMSMIAWDFSKSISYSKTD